VEGDAIGRIRVPALGLNIVLVDGRITPLKKARLDRRT
jgi:hypothetical protein